MLPSAAKVAHELAPGLARLSAAKNQVALTPFVMETWCATLSVFPVAVVNRAILEIALSADPFPDLGKLAIRCQQIVWQSATELAPGRDESKLPLSTVRKVARALGVEV
jgi:hypothetical protein